MPRRFLSVLRTSLVILSITAVSGCAQMIPRPSLQNYPVAPRASIPDGLTARFFGASTLALSDGETTIMIDGFFTRPGAMALLGGNIGPQEGRIARALERGRIGRVAAIFVAHSHFDHVLDTATVARLTGARVLGSASTAAVMRGEDMQDAQHSIIRSGEAHVFGRFTVTPLSTPHSPGGFATGSIEPGFVPPARATAYREGGNFSFLIAHGDHTVLVVPSANPKAAFPNSRADVVFLGIGGLGKWTLPQTDAYWRATVTATGATMVAPIHWDDFTIPLDVPLMAMPYLVDDFATAMGRLTKLARRDGVRLVLPRAFDPIPLGDELS